jgi:hypothetical protein
MKLLLQKLNVICGWIVSSQHLKELEALFTSPLLVHLAETDRQCEMLTRALEEYRASKDALKQTRMSEQASMTQTISLKPFTSSTEGREVSYRHGRETFVVRPDEHTMVSWPQFLRLLTMFHEGKLGDIASVFNYRLSNETDPPPPKTTHIEAFKKEWKEDYELRRVSRDLKPAPKRMSKKERIALVRKMEEESESKKKRHTHVRGETRRPVSSFSSFRNARAENMRLLSSCELQRPQSTQSPKRKPNSSSFSLSLSSRPRTAHLEALEQQERPWSKYMKGDGTNVMVGSTLVSGVRKDILPSFEALDRQRRSHKRRDKAQTEIERRYHGRLSREMSSSTPFTPQPSPKQLKMWRIQHRLEEIDPAIHNIGFEPLFELPLQPSMPMKQSKLNMLRKGVIDASEEEEEDDSNERRIKTTGSLYEPVSLMSMTMDEVHLKDNLVTLDEYFRAQQQEVKEATSKLVKARERKSHLAKGSDQSPSSSYKACPVCSYQFPSSQLNHPTLFRFVAKLADLWGVHRNVFDMGSENMTQYAQVEVCVFCAQFFDPNQHDGLALHLPNPISPNSEDG